MSSIFNVPKFAPLNRGGCSQDSSTKERFCPFLKKEEVFLHWVIRGEDIIDVKRKTSDTASAQTISKTWAIERVCKMFGFDAPTQNEVITGTVSVEQMTDEERKERIKRIYESLNR